MAYGYVQQAVASSFGVTTTIASGAFNGSGTVAAGNCLFWATAWYGADETVAIDDGHANVYSERGHIYDGAGFGLRWGEAKIGSAGVTGGTATFSNAVEQRAILLREYSGLDTSAPFGEQAGASGGGTSATDGWTSGLATPGVQPAVVIGLGYNITGSVPLTVGAGFANFTTTWNFGFGNQGFVEDKRIATLSPVAATFNCSSAVDGGQIAMLILREAAAVGPGLSVAQIIEMQRPRVLLRM